MLSTAIVSYVLIFLCAVCTGACLGMWHLAKASRDYARDCYDYVKENNQKSVAMAEIAELSGELTLMADSYKALMESHKKLRSRVGMRELRASRENGIDKEPEPDSTDADKIELRNRARSVGFKV